MGVATLILRTFADEDIKVHDAMARVQKGTHLHFDFPVSVEKYFNRHENRYRYYPNIATIATDGPSIVQIGRASMQVSQQRLFVENTLYAMPSKYYDKEKDPSEIEVGTARTSVPTSALRRLFERFYRKRKDDAQRLMQYSNAEFLRVGEHWAEDSLLHGHALMVPEEWESFLQLYEEAETTRRKKRFEDNDGIPRPSLLVARDQGPQAVANKESVTTSDFFNPATLQKQTEDKDKIYGFYYLL